MATKKRPKERSSLLVDSKFQRGMLLYINGLLLIVLGLYFYSVFHVFRSLDQQMVLLGIHPSASYEVLVAQQKRSLLALSSVSAGLILFLGNVGILVLSHRIAGPIYRIRRLLQDLTAGGKPENIQFRQSDFFKDLEKECNDYLDSKKT